MADDLQRLAKLAKEQDEAEREVLRIESMLTTAKEESRHLSENVIPELMESLGLSSFTTKEGFEIELKEEIYANISKERQEEALAWLRKNCHGKLIKGTIQLPFTEAERKQLRALLKGRTFKEECGVHHQTLRAFVRSMLEKGKDVPQELFGVHRKRVSKITLTSKG